MATPTPTPTSTPTPTPTDDVCPPILLPPSPQMAIAAQEEAIFNKLIERATASCEFPGDIMVRILTLLPRKSIHRLKAVSMPWCQLLSHPRFNKMHRGLFSVDPDNKSLFFVRHSAVESSVCLINTDSNEKNLDPAVVHLPLSKTETYTGCLTFFVCCKGLVCMKYKDLGATIVLWNPAMECFKFVNRIEEYLVFPEDQVSLGFGYDAKRNDFKVVRIISMIDKDDGAFWGKADVYSVNSDAWTIIYEVDYKFAVKRNSEGTVFGNPFWCATLDEDGDDEEVLVFFNMDELAFRYLSLPPNCNSASDGLCLVEWNGDLGSIQYAYNNEKTTSDVKVWVFEYTCWIHKHTIGPFEGIVDIIWKQPFINGNVVWYKDGKHFMSDPKSGCVREIMIHGDRPNYFEIHGFSANFACALLEGS